MGACKTCSVPLTPDNTYRNGSWGVVYCKKCENARRAAHKRLKPYLADVSRGRFRQLKMTPCETHPECATISREGVLSRSNGNCGICGYRLRKGWHMDHIFPVIRGGVHCYDNLQPAHKGCNLAKGSMTMEEYLAQ